MNRRGENFGWSWRLYFEAGVFAMAVAIASACLATVYDNTVCGPITQWASCACPRGQGYTDYDRCWGSTPKEGAYCYSDVTCMPKTGSQCDYHSEGGVNACGTVYMCPNSPCSAWCVSEDCIRHPEKPPCAGTWGRCQYDEQI
jgi:hypothetical protein